MQKSLWTKGLVVGIIGLFIGASITPNILTITGKAKYTSLVLNPTDDSTIQHDNPEIHYGSDASLRVRNEYGPDGSSGWAENSLIKFNVYSLIGFTISSAYLKINYLGYSQTDPAGRHLNLYLVTSDWNENTVTWSSQPSYASSLTTYSSVPSSGGWMTWDVTNDVQNFLNDVTPLYGWKITDENYWGSYSIPEIFFASKENSGNGPELEIVLSGIVAPAVTTTIATSIGDTTATLNGWLDNMGNAASCDVWFEYGLTTDYGTSTPHQTTTIGSFSQSVTGLVKETTYHCRAVAQNSAGTTYGVDKSFTTTGGITVSTNPATRIGGSTATVNGYLIYTGGAPCEVWFEYGLTTSYGRSTMHQTRTTIGSFSQTLQELKLTTYHFRAVAKNYRGIAYGIDEYFTNIKVPVIQDITITGWYFYGYPTTSNPELGVSGVSCHAIIHPETGFTIDSVSWKLYNNQVTPESSYVHANKHKDLVGSGNPYFFAMPGGCYGNKVVRCYVGYHNTRTGDVGMAVRDKYFKVWFVQGCDDNQNGIPNWYENWKKDGAVPDMDKTVYEEWTGQANCICYGEVKNNIAYLTQYDNGKMFDKPLVLHTYFGTESFGGPTVTGIDCAAVVTAHELYHVWVNNQWTTGGVFLGATDTDCRYGCNDMLPNWYETGWSHTKIDDTDTYGLEHLQQSDYRKYGDQEYMAHRAGKPVKGIVSNDWGYPGKQSIPLIVSMSSLNYNGLSDGYFTGNYSDHGRDIDGDGLYDFLTVTAEINVTSGGLFYPGFQLCDSAGNMITFVDNASVLEMGRQYISRDFDGLKIRSYGVDGPYNITSFLANSYGEIIDRHQNTYRSGSYSCNDFEKQDAVFTGDFSDYGSDVNSNGLYDYLKVDVGVNIETTGEYTVSGWLYNGSEDAIAYANTTVFSTRV